MKCTHTVGWASRPEESFCRPQIRITLRVDQTRVGEKYARNTLLHMILCTLFFFRNQPWHPPSIFVQRAASLPSRPRLRSTKNTTTQSSQASQKNRSGTPTTTRLSARKANIMHKAPRLATMPSKHTNREMDTVTNIPIKNTEVQESSTATNMPFKNTPVNNMTSKRRRSSSMTLPWALFARFSLI